MQDNASQKAVLYAAKSSPDERGSIPDQLDRCRTFAEREGYEVVEEYSEENVSAYHGDRGLELAAALDHAERIGATLIVLHSDRLARGDGKQARHLVEIALWAIKANVTISGVEDPSTFENLVMAAVMGERNTEDSRRKGAAISAGLARRRASGRRTGGNSYALTWRRNEMDERETVVDPTKAPVVDRINAEFLAGTPILRIVNGLNADRIPSLRGSKWSSSSVTSILENPLYAGLVRDGDSLIEAQHDPIISRERYEEALRLRKANARTHPRGRNPVGNHLFRQGFLRCGACGAGMSPRTSRNKDGTLWEAYRCNGHYSDPASCSQLAVLRAPIDTGVYTYFRQVILDVDATRAQLADAADRKRAELAALLQTAEHQAAEAAEQLSRVTRDYVSGELTAAEWRVLRADLEPAAVAAAGERNQMAVQFEEVESGPNVTAMESQLLEQLDRIRAAVAGQVNEATGGVDAVRAALLRLFDSFILHQGVPEDAHVELVGDTYWIEPVLDDHAIKGFDAELRPIIERQPLEQAENNFQETLVWL